MKIMLLVEQMSVFCIYVEIIIIFFILTLMYIRRFVTRIGIAIGVMIIKHLLIPVVISRFYTIIKIYVSNPILYRFKGEAHLMVYIVRLSLIDSSFFQS